MGSIGMVSGGACGVSATTLVEGDSRILGAAETVFLFLRGETGTLQLVTGQSAIFGRNQIRVDLVSLTPTDLLGQPCGHCGYSVEEPSDLCVVLRRRKLAGCMHEGCFRKWFVGQDKAALQPYRFATPSGARVVAPDAMTRVVVGSAVLEAGVEACLLRSLQFTEVMAADERSSKAAERQTVRQRSEARSGTNLFLCPACTSPQEIPFLDTEEKIHVCKDCGGRFQVLVREVRR